MAKTPIEKKTIEKKFSRKMKRKLLLVFALFIIGLFTVGGRLIYIENVSGSRYERIVLDQQRYDSKTIPFKRGDILDAKGTILATSLDVYNLVLDCRLLNQNEKSIEPTIEALVASFPDIGEEEIRSELSEQSNSPYRVLRRKLPFEEIQPFLELQSQAKPGLAGVWFEKEYVRKYPYDGLACKILGFTTSGNLGIGGLEDYYNSSLNGMDGREFGHLNSDNFFERSIREARDGHSLVATMDRNVQNAVEQRIADFLEAHRDEAEIGPGAKGIGIVVMDVNNGDLLAMADSMPYNLNKPLDFSAYFSPEEVGAIDLAGYHGEEAVDAMTEGEKQEEKRLIALNQMWQNFCISNTYEPGSTVKTLTVAAGLETGKVRADETYYCGGYLSVGGHRIHCVKRDGHGLLTIEESIMYSCNVTLMQMAEAIGAKDFARYQDIFHMGLRTHIDLPGEARTDTLVRTAAQMKAADLATNSFGQNFNLTMVQLASAYASTINGGYYYQPRLVKRIVDARGNTVQQFEPNLLKKTVSKETGEQIKQYLKATVEEGTGQAAKVPGHSMGGKTATAEKIPRGNQKYVISFVAHVPADNPQVLVYVVIDEPNIANQAQSGVAARLTAEVLADILPYLNIFPDKELTQEEIEEMEARMAQALASVQELEPEEPEPEPEPEPVVEAEPEPGEVDMLAYDYQGSVFE